MEVVVLEELVLPDITEVVVQQQQTMVDDEVEELDELDEIEVLQIEEIDEYELLIQFLEVLFHIDDEVDDEYIQDEQQLELEIDEAVMDDCIILLLQQLEQQILDEDDEVLDIGVHHFYELIDEVVQ